MSTEEREARTEIARAMRTLADRLEGSESLADVAGGIDILVSALEALTKAAAETEGA